MTMERRFIPARLHAAVDYAAGPALVAAPTLLRLNGSRASALAPRVVGASTTALNAFSDHELAARRLVPMRAHLVADAVAGVALAALPWVTGAARNGVRHWLPHALVGGKEVALAFVTRTEEPRVSKLERFFRLRRALLLAPPLVAAVGVLAWRTGAVRIAADALEEAADELEELTDRLEDAVEKEDD
jgi:hypothetical protein